MAVSFDMRSEVAQLFMKCAVGNASWEECLRGLCEAFDCDKAYLALHNTVTDRSRITQSYNVEPNYIETCNAGLSGEYPWINRESYFQAPGLIWHGSQIVPLDDLRRTDFYNFFMAPQAMLHTVHGVLRTEDSFVTELVLTRTPKQEPFGETDLADIRRLLEPARTAVEAASQIHLGDLIRTAMIEALDDTAIGFALVVGDDNSITTNAIFRDHLASLDPDDSRTYFQQFPERMTVKLPKPLVAGLSKDGRLTDLHLNRMNWQHPISVHIRRVRTDCPLTGDARSGFCILTRDPEQDLEFNAETLRETYDLTPAEFRVASGIARGAVIEQLAPELSITPNTARTHLKRVFDKTGVKRQSELIRLMMASAMRRSTAAHSEHELAQQKPQSVFRFGAGGKALPIGPPGRS